MEMKQGSVSLDGSQLTTATWGSGPVDIVMLHDGLGSIGQWRSVPASVAARSGRTVMAYERAGHGTSTPVPNGPWPPDWLHREARVLDGLLNALAIDKPTVVGHSDGGSAALIYAATAADRIAGVLAIAAHSWVEEICYTSIVDMRANAAPIISGLAKYHEAPVEVFEAWSGGWVSDAFRDWDIRPMLSTIEVPTLISQGTADAYASDDQALLTAAAVGPNAECRLLPGLGHIAHRDDAEAIVDLIVEFDTACRTVS